MLFEGTPGYSLRVGVSEPGPVLSSQFGCGHPGMETQILKV